jgi:hypothetical protein
MFITKFSTENWQGNQNNITLNPGNTWLEIAQAIQELDGKSKTLVTLETDNETHLTIGGGAGKYVVYLTFDNETFYYLSDPTHKDQEVSLIVGGQEGFYPAKLCINNLDIVLQAAETFAKYGTIEKSLTWETDQILELV